MSTHSGTQDLTSDSDTAAMDSDASQKSYELASAAVENMLPRTSMPIFPADVQEHVSVASMVSAAHNNINNSILKRKIKKYNEHVAETERFRKQYGQVNESLRQLEIGMTTIFQEEISTRKHLREFEEYLDKMIQQQNRLLELKLEKNSLALTISTLKSELGDILSLRTKLFELTGTCTGASAAGAGTSPTASSSNEPPQIASETVQDSTVNREGSQDLIDVNDTMDEDVLNEEMSLPAEQRTSAVDHGPTFKCAWGFEDPEEAAGIRQCEATFFSIAELIIHKKDQRAKYAHFCGNVNLGGKFEVEDSCGLELLFEGGFCKGLANKNKHPTRKLKHMQDKTHVIDFELLNFHCHVCKTSYETESEFLIHFRLNKGYVCMTKIVTREMLHSAVLTSKQDAVIDNEMPSVTDNHQDIRYFVKKLADLVKMPGSTKQKTANACVLEAKILKKLKMDEQ